MEVNTGFDFKFEQREQLEKLIEILIEENRGRPLIASYLMNTEEPGQSLKRVYIEQLDDAEQFNGIFDWKKYDDWLDAEDITVDGTEMSGSVMCFNEFDPDDFFPNLFKEIAEAFPSLTFEGYLETITDVDYTYLEFNYRNLCLKLIESYEDSDNDKKIIEKNIKIDIQRNNTYKFPEGIKVIEEGMIPKRKELVSIIIPKGVEQIGNKAFKGCKNLTSITIPEGVEEIGWFAFEGCKNLTSIELPNSLKKIGYNAFRDCKKLKNINLPLGLACIDEYAFVNCESLTKIVIPEGITELTATFCDCKGLTSISLPKSLRYINDEKSGMREYYRAGNIFSGCESLKSVKLPEGIKVIGRGAFRNCISLTNIEVPKSLKLIMGDAFENCPNLEHIEGLRCNTNLRYGIFDGCPKLNYTIQSGEVKSLGWWNVQEDRNAENITIPNSVVEIGKYGFEGWTNLTSVIIPDGVSRICDYAFSDCRSLKNVIIPESVTKIDEYAFQNCKSLEQIILPKSLKRIGDYAFKGCNNLMLVQMLGTPSYNGFQTFLDCENIKIQEPSKFTFDRIDSLKIEGSIFVLTGFFGDEEEKIKNVIQQGGGVIKKSTVLKTNYLVVNEDYNHQTTKYTRAMELKDQGKPISIISEKQFYNLASK